MFKTIEKREANSYKLYGEHASCIVTMYNNGKANIMIVDCVETEEEFRKQGFGTKLLESVLETARINGCDAVELLVNSDNYKAMWLYSKLGFEQVGTKQYWRKILNKWE